MIRKLIFLWAAVVSLTIALLAPPVFAGGGRPAAKPEYIGLHHMK